MAITIRPATEADQSTIRRQIRDANLNPMSLDWPNFLVADDDGAIVGVGQIKRHRDGSREVASIAVTPDRQGEGIGSAIIKALLDRHGQELLHLTCRREMQGYYERFGFQHVSPREFPPYFARMLPVINVFARLARTQIVLMRREPVRATTPG